MLRRPYFMENDDWYEFDEETEKFVLTDKAPVEAVESYKKYLKEYEYAANDNIAGLGDVEDEENRAKNLFGF